MKEQLEKDIALIGRYCETRRTNMMTSRSAGRWRISIGHSTDLQHESYEGAIHLAAMSIATRIEKLNREAIEKVTKELSSAQAVVGDWSAEA